MNSEPIAEWNRRAGREEAHGGAVRTMFDRIAPTYDAVNRILSAGIDVRWRRRAVSELKGAPPGEILDLCAGTLDLAAEVERSLPDRRVVAVDFAADMLARGQHKVRRTQTVVGDALALPFPDGHFSAAICGFGLRNLSDPARGIAEAARVLKPSGRLIILEFFRPKDGLAGSATRAFHAVYARGVLPMVGALVARDREAYAYLAKSMASFLSRSELESIFVEQGFESVHGEDLTLAIASIVSGVKRAK